MVYQPDAGTLQQCLARGESGTWQQRDFGPAFLTAMDITTGEERWRERSFARSHMLYADGKVVLVDEDGGGRDRLNWR